MTAQREGDAIPPRAWVAWIILFMALAAVFPRDASYDVAHYQLHNGWAWWNDRAGVDFAPAEMHSFLNPAYNIVVWWLVETLPGPLVNAIFAVPQALILPVLYALTRSATRLAGVQPPAWMCLLIAAAGFFAALQASLFASIRNDAWGALGFIAALALCVRPDGRMPGWRSLAAASGLIGLLVGMKVTNVCYLFGFAALILVLARSHGERFRAVLICAVAGGIGLALIGGPAAWDLWIRFGNPFFPRVNSVFESPLGPTGYEDFGRRTPDNFRELLVYPFIFTVNSAVVSISNFVDPRYLMSYLGAPAIICVVGWRAHKGVCKAEDRALLALSAALLVAMLSWVHLFSVARYMLAAWIMGPTVLTVAVLRAHPGFLSERTLRLAITALMGALIVTISPLNVRREAWDRWNEPYVDASIPSIASYEDAFVIFAGPGPAAFLAPFFPESAVFGHADAQEFSKPTLMNYAPLQRAAIAASDKPIFAVIATISDVEQTLTDLERDEDLSGVAADCLDIETSFDKPQNGETWVLCPLKRVSPTNVRDNARS